MKEVTKSRKRTMLIMILIVLSSTIIVYALSKYYFKGTEYRSDFVKKVYFEFEDNDPFIGNPEIGPGESLNIYPYIHSTASEDMYCVIMVEMPACYDKNGQHKPLYNITPSPNWHSACLNEDDDRFYEYFIYDSLLPPDDYTDGFGIKYDEDNWDDAGSFPHWTVTMTDVSRGDYGQMEDINMGLTGYGVSVDDQTPDEVLYDVIEYQTL